MGLGCSGLSKTPILAVQGDRNDQLTAATRRPAPSGYPGPTGSRRDERTSIDPGREAPATHLRSGGPTPLNAGRASRRAARARLATAPTSVRAFAVGVPRDSAAG